MTKKIEKLKEINAMIGERLMELETHMFVEKIYDTKEIVGNEQTPKALL